jgi:hypothetical protein
MVINKKSKFYTPVPIKKQVVDFFKSLLFWKGRKKGMIHTMNIKWDHIRAVFFPKNFYEKFQYLGVVPWKEEGDMFEAIEPLVIFIDYKAKPSWCPRWVLRFLHLFGNDNSIVRVRNRTLHNLSRKLTKGYLITDYKTKWSWYDLRLHVQGSEQMHNLVRAIEQRYYDQGRRTDLIEKLSKLTNKPEKDYNFWMLSELEREWEKLNPKY